MHVRVCVHYRFARVQLRVLCLHYDAGLCVRSLVPTMYGITCYKLLAKYIVSSGYSTN